MQVQPDRDIALRDPATVMRLARMGSFHQTRLSFMRALLRRLKRDDWRFDRPVWRFDQNGEGVAVYRARGPERTYSLVCFGHDLDPALRSDRVIAEAWDATFALFDGEPTEDDIARLARNVPGQEAGRYTRNELVLSRANRSVRLFEHVVACLAEGRQPDPEQVKATGYLMRTTAVYGNGKLGMADRERIADRVELAAPFRAEMLAVWLIRAFTIDLVEEMARRRAPATAVTLESGLRRRLGVGNSTGLGMAPFLVNHPALLDAWMTARETALARVRALPHATAETAAAFRQFLRRARRDLAEWRTGDDRQRERIAVTAAELDRLSAYLDGAGLDIARPWDALYRWAEDSLSPEGQELTVTLLLEPHGELIDDLADVMSADEDRTFRIDGGVTVAGTMRAVERHHGWALPVDFGDPARQARFWYVSEEKLEPRLGERHAEPGAELEQPLATGRDAARFHMDLAATDGAATLAEFLIAHPEHRHMARRVQIAECCPYAEIRDNLVDADLLAIDLLRCKLSFFGATRFDPRSDRWVRITMYQGAPYPDELAAADADDWAFPPVPEGAA